MVFCIVLVYVDDLNIIGYVEDIEMASVYLKIEFEIWGKPNFAWA
jgi:hypothetical protein